MPKYVVVRSVAVPAESTRARQAAPRRPRGTVLSDVTDGVFMEVSDAAFAALKRSGAEFIEFGNPNELRIAGHKVNIRQRAQRRQARRAPEGERQVPKEWRNARQFVAQFKAPPEVSWLSDVESHGLRITGRLGQFGVVLEGDADAAGWLASRPNVAYAAPYEPKWRVSPNLAKRKGTVRFVSIRVTPASAADVVAAEVKRLKGAVETMWAEDVSPGVDQRVIIAAVPANAIKALAAHPDVRWIDYQPPTYEPEDERSAQIVAGNFDGAAAPNTLPVVGYGAQLGALGINGAGVVIAINDTGVDTNTVGAVQADLAGRIAFVPGAAGGGDTDGHGTHVAGIAAGNGATGDTDPGGFRLGQGVAPGARVGVVVNASAASIATFSQVAAQNASQVMNCSWQVNPPGNAYSTLDAVIDQSIRDADGVAAGSQALAVCFSAGNSGPGASTLTKQTKNGLVVGNSLNGRPGEGANDDVRGLSNSSSCGPAADGRLLPNFIAPGTDVISARSTIDANAGTPGVQRPRTAYTDTIGTTHNDHVRLSGTSMASPHVAGLCALLIEWWRDRTGGRTPSPAMLKALIVNGAIDCAGGPDGNGGTLTNIPNTRQGWGRANLRNIVLSAPDVQRGPKLFVDQRHAFTASGQEFTLRVAVVDATRPMRVTLTWTDAPGDPASATLLVNDLDLRVTERATGRQFLGNVFSGGFSTTGGSRDQVNNVECVYVQAPVGEFDVTVRATSVTMNARPPFTAASPWQDFALVVDNAERAASAPIGAVTVMDRSGSMISSAYVDVTRTAAKTFIDMLRVDDDFGLVSFGSTATTAFSSGSTVRNIGGAADRTAAGVAVDGIAFGGMTAMGPGLSTGAGLLSATSGQRGIVLLSDGYDNGSPSAATVVASFPPALPVYSCAMGPLSDQVLLEQIATSTAGRYYFMPTIDDLFEIHNYISATLTGDSIVTNESAQASSSRVEAWIDPTCAAATFTVAWADALSYTTADQPRRASEISVRLRLPNGKLLPANAGAVRRIVSQRSVLFRVEDPAPGRWFIEVSTAREAHTRYTAAAFVDSPLRLHLKAAGSLVRLGLPWSGEVFAVLKQEPVKDVRVDGRIRVPLNGVDDVVRKYGRLVARAPRIKGTPDNVAKARKIVELLRRQGKPNPFDFKDSRASWRPSDASGSSFTTKALVERTGSTSLTVTVRGVVPGTSDPFIRKEMASFVVA